MFDSATLFLSHWLYSLWEMLVLSGPWLLFGLFLAGVIHECLSSKFVAKQISKPGLVSILKASAFGLPLPLCSCSVIPVGVSLRRSGASRGATSSFFVSTPEIGVDSFFLSYVLLGPWLACARAIAAFISALLAGLSVDLLSREPELATASQKPAASCCSSKGSTEAETVPVSRRSIPVLIKRAVRFGFVELLDDISKLLVVGFLIAGFITAIFPADLFSTLSVEPFVYSCFMLLASLPIYVCSVASTPIAAALLLKGVPPGAVLVFLLAGPATNISTMLVLKKELGLGALCYYLASVVGVAMLAALLIDYGSLGDVFNVAETAAALAQEGGHSHFSITAQLIAVTLCVLLAASLLRQAQKKRA